MSLLNLHANLSKEYDMPPFDEFAAHMQDENNLRQLHSNISNAYNLPEYSTFRSDMGINPPKMTAQQEDQVSGQDLMRIPHTGMNGVSSLETEQSDNYSPYPGGTFEQFPDTGMQPSGRYGDFTQKGNPPYQSIRKEPISTTGVYHNPIMPIGNPYDTVKSDLLKQYPAFQKVYGENGENLAISNNDKLPYGIEYIGKGQPNVDYGNGLVVNNPHPKLGHGLLINQSKLQTGMPVKEVIAGDMLHGMRQDPEYANLYNNFKTSFEKSGLENDTKHWFDQADEDTKKDGYDKFKQNDIDARIRILLQPNENDYGTFTKEMTPAMKNAGNDIQLYLTRNSQGKSMINLPDNYNILDKANNIAK